MTGYFTGTADFGGISLTSVGSADGYVAKYAPTGSLLWATRFGGSATYRSRSPASYASRPSPLITGEGSGQRLGSGAAAGRDAGAGNTGTGPVR